MEPLPVGSFVKAWWDTGAFGMTIMYGIVRQSGPRAALVEWRSGVRNRISLDNLRGCEPVTRLDDLALAMKDWKKYYLFS